MTPGHMECYEHFKLKAMFFPLCLLLSTYELITNHYNIPCDLTKT